MFCGTKSYDTCSNAVLISALTQLYNRFATRLLPCRWYVVRSQPRNSPFRCVKSPLLL